MKTTITSAGTRVILTYTCDCGKTHERTFSASSVRYAYVRENHGNDRRQVGEGLESSGNMLGINGEDETALIRCIRREWKNSRKRWTNCQSFHG